MRILALAALLAFAVPVRAQRAADVPARMATTVLSETPNALGLGQLFNAQTLQFSQSAEVSYGGGAGGAVGLGLYTASLRWQPSTKLAGRVDIGVAQALAGSGFYAGLQSDQPQVFLRNAELAYRPTENATFHLSVRQSPYGTYASPYGTPYGSRGYGAYGGYGRSGFGVGVGSGSAGDLFFRDAE
ncbi:hypothetical protein [Rubrivirga sp.]|uniref:hypothetical protein n=1 Tax=Rubrivirga sp. TaxID=1885344 RepID=UPI003B51EDEF